MQIFASGKRRFYQFFHGILCNAPKKIKGKKFDHSTTLATALSIQCCGSTTKVAFQTLSSSYH